MIKKVLGTLLIIIVALAAIGYWIVRSSADAVPGDLNYALKRRIETVVANTKNTPAEKIDYEIDVLINRRLIELKKVKDDVSKTTEIVTELNEHIGNYESYFKEMMQKGNNDKSFEYFEKINLSIYSIRKTLDASKETYPGNKEYVAAVDEGYDRFTQSVGNTFEIAVNNFQDYEPFNNYAQQVFQEQKYPEVTREVQYLIEDFNDVREYLEPAEADKIDARIKEYEAKYDALFAERESLNIKEIYDRLEELDQMEYDISVELVDALKETGMQG